MLKYGENHRSTKYKDKKIDDPCNFFIEFSILVLELQLNTCLTVLLFDSAGEVVHVSMLFF